MRSLGNLCRDKTYYHYDSTHEGRLEKCSLTHEACLFAMMVFMNFSYASLPFRFTSIQL